MPPPAATSKPHTAVSATLLLMGSSLLSGVLALLRLKYVNHLFGAGQAQDAYRAAFTLPNLLNYFLIGGAASISMITVLSRFREAEDEEGADRALSVVLCTMLVVLAGGVLLGEVFAPQYVRLANSGYRMDVSGAALCTALTRLLLPAQLFFFIGSILSSRLQVRKIFVYQAFTPLIYNGGIILGAVLLHRKLGVFSLAWGVLAGVILGSALLNALGAFRTGFRFYPRVNFRAAAFREWLRLSLPLMIGVSLVMFDGIFLNYFASTHEGGITLIGTAKDLFNAPFNVIGPAAGAASLPFFASLFQQGRAFDFSATVARSVSRLFAVGLLVSGWMLALAPWILDLMKGGKFNRVDAATATRLFAILAITLAMWAVQGIYARAFYAAGDTRTPAVTGTLITVLSLPLYFVLYWSAGLIGLAVASDIGITVQTATLAILLHRKRLVSLAQLEVGEIGRSALAATVGWAAAAGAAHWLPGSGSHQADVLTLCAGTLAWAAAATAVLQLTGSQLPRQLMRLKS